MQGLGAITVEHDHGLAARSFSEQLSPKVSCSSSTEAAYA